MIQFEKNHKVSFQKQDLYRKGTKINIGSNSNKSNKSNMPSVITVFEPKTKEAMISNTVKVMVPPSDSLKILFSVLYFCWSIINKKSFLFLLKYNKSGIIQ